MQRVYEVHGAWCVVRGAWCMVHGAWYMVHGAWCMVHEHQRGDMVLHAVITHCSEQSPLAKLIVFTIVTNFPLFVVPGGSLRSSQKIATCSYIEPDESSR